MDEYTEQQLELWFDEVEDKQEAFKDLVKKLLLRKIIIYDNDPTCPPTFESDWEAIIDE